MKTNSIVILLLSIMMTCAFFCSNDKGTGPVNEEQDEPQVLRGAYLGQTLPGTTPAVFASGIISNKYAAHSAAVFSPDGNEVFWTVGYTNPWTLHTFHMRIENGSWTSRTEASFSTAGSMPFYSTDGSRFFYVEDSSEGKSIMVMERTADGWADPVQLGYPFIDADLGWQASCTADGTIYFSIQNGEYGLWDIYRSELDYGNYSDPVNLGESINSNAYDGSPYISPDESYLIFSSIDRPGGSGGSDLYISFRDQRGNWGESINMGSEINTPQDDVFPFMSPDGEYLFFVSYRNGSQDVYWMDAAIIETLKK
ncbi:hypothetical protein ACFL6O_04250 [candidate division KSB1 bacterium]